MPLGAVRGVTWVLPFSELPDEVEVAPEGLETALVSGDFGASTAAFGDAAPSGVARVIAAKNAPLTTAAPRHAARRLTDDPGLCFSDR